MDDDGWIVIPNWEKFQHYKDRTPPWIKLYTELNHKPEWLALPMAAKGWLSTCWVEYALSHGALPLTRLRMLAPSDADAKYMRRHIESLNQAGFLRIVASQPLEQRQRRERKKRERANAPVNNPAPAAVEAKTNAAAYKPFNDQLEKPWPPDEWLNDA